MVHGGRSSLMASKREVLLPEQNCRSMAVVGLQALRPAGQCLDVEAYAFYVENKMDDPFYQPSCSSSWTGGNCVARHAMQGRTGVVVGTCDLNLRLQCSKVRTATFSADSSAYNVLPPDLAFAAIDRGSETFVENCTI